MREWKEMRKRDRTQNSPLVAEIIQTPVNIKRRCLLFRVLPLQLALRERKSGTPSLLKNSQARQKKEMVPAYVNLPVSTMPHD